MHYMSIVFHDYVYRVSHNRQGYGGKLFKPPFWAGALHVYRYII